VSVTRLILRRGAKANSRDPEFGMTPLISAISSGSFANVLLLLDHGADVISEVILD
jgi:ankyrin repeat protein